MHLTKEGMKSVREGFEKRMNVLSDLVYLVRYRKLVSGVASSEISMSAILATLRRMLAAPGLTKNEARQVHAYYAPYKVSTLMHRLAKAASGDFNPAYIPLEMYFPFIDPYLNSHDKAKGLESKCLFDRLFPGIRQPETVAYRINGYWLSPDLAPLGLDKVISLANAEEAVFLKKSDESCGGHGVVRVAHTANEAFGESFARAAQEIEGDILVQKAIRQHPDIARFNASSVNTYRIVTLLTEKGDVYVCNAVFRVGAGGGYVDNFSSGGVMVGIDTHGKLRKTGFSGTGAVTEKHPVSGICFEGVPMPSFARAVAMVKRAHPMLPMFRLISWDVAIEENGEPVLIEANLTNGGAQPMQVCNGPFFRNMTRKVFREAMKDTNFPKYRGKKKKA